jgi:hypothetical protein
MSFLRSTNVLLRTPLWTCSTRIAGFATASSPNSAAAPSAAVTSASDAVQLVKKEWSPEKKRAGLLAVKIGMMPVWDHYGYRHNCTVLQVGFFFFCDMIIHISNK